MSRVPALAAAIALALSEPALAGDPVAGEKLFAQCAVCHEIGPGAANDVGPALNGVIGRPMASVAGFAYSKAILAKAAEGLVWDEATLDAYLARPARWLRGTKMSFAGLRTPEERADVIAYLARFP
jgi:cytochrome c